MHNVVTYRAIPMRDNQGRFTNFLKEVLKLPFRFFRWIFSSTIAALYWSLAQILPSRSLAIKIGLVQLVIVSLVMNVWFARQIYVVRCSAGGMFMTKQKCGEEADAQFYTEEYYRLQSTQDN